MLGLGLSLTSLSLSPVFHSILRFIRSNQPGDYYQLDTPVTFATGQEFTIELITDLSPTGGYLLADTQQTFRLAYDTSGAIIISITENGTLSDRIHPGVLQPYQDGALHKVEFMRRNGFLLLAINGTFIVAEYSDTEITFDTIFKGWAIQRYFTRIDNSTKGFSLPAPINLQSGPVAMRVRMAFLGVVAGRLRPVFSNSAAIELDAYDDSIDFRYNYSGPSSPLPAHETAFGDGSIVEYLLRFDGSNVEGFINGASTGVVSRTAAAQTLTGIFATGSSGGTVVYPLSVEVWGNSNDIESPPSFEVNFDSDGTAAEEVDIRGGNNLTRVGLSSADTELFTFDDASNSWKNSDSTVILPVTYS